MTKPAPLTPSDCDLTSFPFMPLDVARFRNSDLALETDPATAFAAVLLWAASWHQVPAASLPNNDKVLAQLAGFGRFVDQWQAVRADALRGFVECSDGRLYHPVVAEKALEALRSKVKRQAMTEAARAAKAARNQGPDSVTENATESETESETGSNRHRHRHRKVRGKPLTTPKKTKRAGAPENLGEVWTFDDAAKAIAERAGLSPSEAAKLAEEHADFIEANEPKTRTAKALANLWQRRCEAIVADAPKLKALRKRVARSKPSALEAIKADAPEWWREQSALLLAWKPDAFRSYFSQCEIVGPHQLRAATRVAFERLEKLAEQYKAERGFVLEILPPETASTGKAAK